MGIHVLGLHTLPEIRPGDDLGPLILAAAGAERQSLGPETIVVIAQKIVSKAEGAIVDLRGVEPSRFAIEWAAQWGKDARVIELVLRQSRRIIKMDRGVLIAETHHGLVAANAGVDQSNVPRDQATILPRDPDASARTLLAALGCGAVIVSDTFGRPWREGLVNVAIGVAGLQPLDDFRGTVDPHGRRLEGTILAVADELAAVSGLVMRKIDAVPVVLIAGFGWKSGPGSARDLIRPAEHDLFR